MKQLFLILSFMFVISANVYAGAPTCHSHSSGPYCSYRGKVKNIYLNQGNLILIYFDENLDLSKPASVGINGVRRVDAAAYRLSSNEDFGKLFYSTALAAQASGRKISIHLRGTESGYLKIDRFWLAAP